MLSLTDIEAAARNVYAAMSPTPQYAWPLLAQRAGCEVWVKHENHTPTGAFKVRGGLNLLAQLTAREPQLSRRDQRHARQSRPEPRVRGAAPRRALHDRRAAGQLARQERRDARIRRRARRARPRLRRGARARGPRSRRPKDCASSGPFERELVAGVATYALEFFRAAPDLDTVFVPIGCGSGICGLIAARDALGLATRIVGVVSTNANAYAQSFRKRARVETASAVTIADGMAVRVPVPAALDIIWRGAHDVVEVTDAEVEAAIRAYFDDTHQLAEGAGAAPLAALLKTPRRAGKRMGVILTGGNIDRDVYARVLEDMTREPGLV